MRPEPQSQRPEYRGSGKLDGKVALITGGDSGIGRAVAIAYAREGADVAIVYLDEREDAEQTQREGEATGRRTSFWLPTWTLPILTGQILHPNGGTVVNG